MASSTKYIVQVINKLVIVNNLIFRPYIEYGIQFGIKFR